MSRDEEILVRSWRISEGESSGSHCWFDPCTEYVKIFRLPPPVSEEGLELMPPVAREGEPSYLDKVGSVSASGQVRASQASSSEVNDPLPNLGEDLPF